MATFIRDVEEIRQRAMRQIEDGAVTESYQADKDRAISILNEALATEVVCVLRYMHHYFMATGVHGRAVADVFKEHADEEREHMGELGERIQQLGGKPDFNPSTLLKRSVSQYIEGETLADMIREDLIAERTVIEVYQEMVRYFGLKDPTTRALIEHILAEEEEHASELTDFLYIVNPETGETQGQDPGTNPLHLGEKRRRQSEGDRFSSTRRSDTAAMRRSRGINRLADDIDPDVEVGEALAGLSGLPGTGTPRRDKTRPLDVAPTPQDKGGATQPSGGKRQNREQADKDARRGEERPTKERAIANKEGRETSEVASTPGVGGRPMNRRRTTDDIDKTDVADRINAGGAHGTNRSARILNKTRKKRAA